MILTINMNSLQVPTDRFVNLSFIVVGKSKLIAKPILFNTIMLALLEDVIFTHFEGIINIC